LGENTWYILAENNWRIMGENKWHIYVRYLTSVDQQHQRRYYSGKKRFHTVKNLLLVNALLSVLYLSGTQEGRASDKRIADFADYQLPEGSTLLQDLGFLAFTVAGIEVVEPVVFD